MFDALKRRTAPTSPGRDETPGDELAEFLLRKELLDAKSLERACRVAAEGGGRLETVLTKLGLLQ